MDRTLSVDQERGERDGWRERPFLYLLATADRPLAPSVRWSLDGVERVTLGRARAEAGSAGAALGLPAPDLLQAPQRLLALELQDSRVSSSHAALSRAGDGWQLDDQGSKNGTWIDGRRVQSSPLSDGDLIEVGHSFLLFRARSPAPPGLPPAAVALAPLPGVPTLLPELARQLAQLDQLAISRVPICLTGETGTGKELLARAIHRRSGRPGPLVAVNCGAIARNLLESELFGYRKGAFSGASEDRPGLVRSAEGGTLFLDEFAELSPEAQAGLLRVLQESEVLPVGGTRPVPVDLRVVVATHQDLETLVATGAFRADLLARVCGFRMLLPALRERREDLGSILAELLRRHAPGRPDVTLTPEALRALLLYRWPLNVRELEKCLVTALALCGQRPIELADLPEALRRSREGAAAATPRLAPEPLCPEDAALRERLVGSLREHAGNVTAVALALGEHRTQVHRWVKRLGIDPDSFRG